MAKTIKQTCSIEQIAWSDARDTIKPLRPEFAKIIDELNPGKHLPLYRARYPFGSRILQNSVFSIPNDEQELVPITDSSIPNKIREQLHYSHDQTVPVGIVTHNMAESFFEFKDRFMPFSLMLPGRIFALYRALDSPFGLHAAKIRNITAGARSIFMLPKITDDAGHKRIKREFHIHSNTPKSLQEHWDVFKSLANSPEFKTPWYVEFIYFGKAWFEDNENDPVWTNFYRHLYESAWNSTSFWRNYVVLDLIFSRALSAKNLRPNPYLADTVKHLAIIGMGAAPGFQLANNEMAGPIHELEKIYQDIYQIRNNYTPSIMVPSTFNMNESKHSIYYSLRYPTAFEFSPKSRNATSTMRDLHEVKHITDSIVSDILSREDITETPLYRLCIDALIQFFHSENDALGEIQPSKEIFNLDPAFQENKKRTSNPRFCDTAPFFRGCIRLSSKKE